MENRGNRMRLYRPVLWISLLQEPLTCCIALLAFILYKDLGASLWQTAMLIAARPVVALLSTYWGAHLFRQPKSLRSNLLVSGVLARLPFLGVFLCDSPGYLIVGVVIYQAFSRAGVPAWMEVLKQNFGKDQRERLFAIGYMLGFAEGIFLGLGVGLLLDTCPAAWRTVFFLSAIIGLVGVFVQSRVPTTTQTHCATQLDPVPRVLWWHTVLLPWRDSWQLLRQRPDFARFQWGFMFGGSGLMLIASVLPAYFIDGLQLSYTEFTTSRMLCMGVGIIFSSTLWARAMKHFSLHQLAGIVNAIFSFYAVCLLLASLHLSWLFLAFIVYGIGQAGSHNIWHLSGPAFAGTANSSPYSVVNILTVGVRGLIFPVCGACLCHLLGSLTTICVGMLLFIYGTCTMRLGRRIPATAQESSIT